MNLENFANTVAYGEQGKYVICLVTEEYYIILLRLVAGVVFCSNVRLNNIHMIFHKNRDQVGLLKTPRSPFPRQLRILAKGCSFRTKNTFHGAALLHYITTNTKCIYGHDWQSPYDFQHLYEIRGWWGGNPMSNLVSILVKYHLEIN